MAQNTLAPYETNFYLAHDQVVHLKTSTLTLEGRGNKTHCFPWGDSLSSK